MYWSKRKKKKEWAPWRILGIRFPDPNNYRAAAEGNLIEYRQPLKHRLLSWDPEKGVEYAPGRFVPAWWHAKHHRDVIFSESSDLYVKEPWARIRDDNGVTRMAYKAAWDVNVDGPEPNWSQSTAMTPRFARTFMRMVDLDLVRIQDITEEEAMLEGCPLEYLGDVAEQVRKGEPWFPSARKWFETRWKAYYPGSWERNDIVWRFTLKDIVKPYYVLTDLDQTREVRFKGPRHLRGTKDLRRRASENERPNLCNPFTANHRKPIVHDVCKSFTPTTPTKK